VDVLRQIASIHGISVSSQTKKDFLIQKLCDHCCGYQDCAVYIFRARGNPRRVRSRPKRLNLGERAVTTQIENDDLLGDETDEYVQKQIEESIRAQYPRILSEEDRMQFLKHWYSEFKNENFRRNVCAACSHWEFVLENKFKWVDFNDVPLDKLCNPELPIALLPDTYNVDVYNKALLNPKGIKNKTDRGPIMLCPVCQSDLLGKNKMPKFALAN
jgi:hypothetical protein